MRNWLDLGVPRPRDDPSTYEPVRWDEGNVLAFPETVDSDSEDPALLGREYAKIVSSRRTRYDYRPVPFAILGQLFERSARATASVASAYGFPLSRRAAPSAGGIHPIHIVLHIYGEKALRRYDAFDHVLRELKTDVSPVDLRSAMNQILEGQHGALLLFVAEPGKTSAKYNNAASLVWRDAGVLLAFFALAAESLNLNFSPLGTTGDPWAMRLVDKRLVGVGAAYVGART